MKTIDIISTIREEFAKTYTNASRFVDSGELWDFCMDTIQNPVLLSNIVFANDMGVPPVKSLITIYERQKKPMNDFTMVESQYMGALMGYLFKNILGYNGQKQRCSVNKLGVRTATRFFDGPVHEFEF